METKRPYPTTLMTTLPERVCCKTYLILPAYNESSVIGSVIKELQSLKCHIVVVDDGSSDNTCAQARAAGATVLRHIVNRGQGAAIQTGITYSLMCGAEYVVTFDSDGQHCAEDVPNLLLPIHEGRCDIALGSRFLGSAEHMPQTRRLVLKAAVLFTRLVSRVKLTDTHNGLRAFSRRAASQVHITLDRMAHASELLDQVGRMRLSFTEVPVHVRYTEYSCTKGQRSLTALRIVMDYLVGKICA